MNEFDTSKYNISRKEDNSLVRVDGLGGETPEMDVDYYNSQIAYHEQVVANLEAQKAKVEEFEADNPVVELEPETEGWRCFVRGLTPTGIFMTAIFHP